jgi:peptidoglycan hydrolase-like protein with peptidoglycan-binding domain
MTRALSLLAALALALAACGGDGGSLTGDPATTTTAADGTTAAGGETPSTIIVEGGVGGDIDWAVLASMPYPDPTVSFLQQALDELGYHAGAVDGLYGQATSEAVAAFQRDHGLEPTGHVDAATIEELERQNDHIEHLLVEAMQTQLTELGAYSGMVDGIWGPDSDAAIAAFQEREGLPATGKLDEQTFAALVVAYDVGVVAPHRDAASAAGVGGEVHDSRPQLPVGEFLQQGDEGPEVEALQRRLAELGYRAGDADGRFGAQTASAVLAFQKREGLQRDQVVGPDVQARLADPQGAGPRSDAPGRRIEVDLDRQILFAIEADGTVTTINTSTGSGKEFQSAEPGKGIVVAHTPVGEFSILRVIDANEKAPLGTLYRPMYFTWEGGFAIHGNPNVPAYPASHGCARTANWDQDFLWDAGFGVDDPVWVYGENPPAPDNAAGGF